MSRTATLAHFVARQARGGAWLGTAGMRDNGSSVIVVFPLVANASHDDGPAVDDLEQRDIACACERDDQFTQERARADLAAGERKSFQQLEAALDRVRRLVGPRGVAAVARQLLVDQELDPPQEVVFGLAGQADRETHRAPEASIGLVSILCLKPK